MARVDDLIEKLCTSEEHAPQWWADLSDEINYFCDHEGTEAEIEEIRSHWGLLESLTMLLPPDYKRK